jgi:hypothetical protein
MLTNIHTHIHARMHTHTHTQAGTGKQVQAGIGRHRQMQTDAQPPIHPPVFITFHESTS